MAKRKPRVTVKCVANARAADNERIVEFSDPRTGKGGLLSLRLMDDGTLYVEAYRLDEGVVVAAPASNTKGPA